MTQRPNEELLNRVLTYQHPQLDDDARIVWGVMAACSNDEAEVSLAPIHLCKALKWTPDRVESAIARLVALGLLEEE